MQDNILSTVFRSLPPEVIGKIASALGRDRASIEKTVQAAVPAILSGMASLSSTPDGAQRLENTINWEQAGAAERGTDVTRGGESGKGALSSLFGYTAVSELAGVLAQFTGVNTGTSRSVLGLVTPAILGTLGRAQQETGANSAGLAQMLSAQKGKIASAMPPGLSQILDASGFFSSINPVQATDDRPDEGYTTAHPAPAARADNGGSGWLYWALPLVALAGLAWYVLPNWEQNRTEETAQPAGITKTPPPGGVAAADIGREVNSALDSLNSSLQQVTDATSAKAALPKLQQATSELDRAATVLAKLPIETRRTVANLTGPAISKVKSTLQQTAHLPGVATALAQPTIDGLQTKLDTLGLMAAAATTPGVAAGAGAGAGDSAAPQGATVARVTFLSRATTGATSASTFYVRDVYNRTGEKLGTVNDLILEPTGKVTAAIIGVGDFLGIGEKEVAVPFALVEVVRGDKSGGKTWHVVIDATKESLNSAPAFDSTLDRVRLNPATR